MFSDVGIGPAAFYKSPVLLGQHVNIEIKDIDQFSFGIDARFKKYLIVVEATALTSVGSFNVFDLYLDAGINFEADVLSFMLGLGPNLTYNNGPGPSIDAGLNVKATAEIKFDRVSFGTSYIMDLRYDEGLNLTASSGLLGVQILFWTD